jgi:protein involved in polysaccharide export with SLBB domain
MRKMDMKHFTAIKIIPAVILQVLFIFSDGPLTAGPENEYTTGPGDILRIEILQPDRSTNDVTVSPDGYISVTYLGSIKVKGLSISAIQKHIQTELAKGYFRYPVVVVSLIESRSRSFTVNGEVNRPGSYPIEENTTVLKAISIAGGFTRFGSSSNVKVLRPRKDRPGYNIIKVDIKAAFEGHSDADIVLQSGDIVVVSESLF